MTLIGGKSCSGKTMLYKAFTKLASINDAIICLNKSNKNMDILDLINKNRHKIIVVDNADIVLNSNIKFKMAIDPYNQYILLGRDPYGLCLGNNEYAELIIRDNVGVLYYPYKIGD